MSEDASAVMFVRPLPGVVGERDREVHVVPMPDPNAIPDVLTAYCGLRFAPGTTELLNEPSGMPCVRCLATAPVPEIEQHQLSERNP